MNKLKIFFVPSIKILFGIIMLLILGCGSQSSPAISGAKFRLEARDPGAVSFEEVWQKPRFEYPCDKSAYDCFWEVLDMVVLKYFKYPEEVGGRRIGGRVFVTLIVRNTGEVRVVDVKGPDPLLEQAAFFALKKNIPRAYPGLTLYGLPVPVEYNYFFNIKAM